MANVLLIAKTPIQPVPFVDNMPKVEATMLAASLRHDGWTVNLYESKAKLDDSCCSQIRSLLMANEPDNDLRSSSKTTLSLLKRMGIIA